MRQKIDVRKRQKIRAEFRRFKELCSDVPSGKPHFFDGTIYDPPDVCIGGGEVGIEFRNFFHGEKQTGGSTLKATETKYDEIIRAAEEQFSRQYNIALNVSPLWFPGRHPSRPEEQEIIQTLVKLISHSIPPDFHVPLRLSGNDFAGGCLKRYVKSITIIRLKQGASSVWGNRKSGWPEVGIEDIESRIKEKEKDLPRYRDKFNSVWLVIFASVEFMASAVILDSTVQTGCITSKFDRVYFFNGTDQTLTCLTGEKN